MPSIKYAVIVYGKRFAGKNYTLNCHFKPMVKLSGGQRLFHLQDSVTRRILDCEIRTQCFEDAGYTPQSVANLIENRLISRDRLVIVTWPPTAIGSLFSAVKQTLIHSGYDVRSVEIENNGGTLNPDYYAGKAKQIYGYI